MTDLKNQRRLASQVLKIGQNRVWIDPERTEDAEVAMTREEIRKLIHEGAIKSRPEVGVSRGRARVLHAKKKRGRRSGPGSKGGSSHAKISRKEAWMGKIRALRKRLRELRTRKIVTSDTYRQIYVMASSGRFESVAEMDRYIKSHELWRKR